MISPSKHELVDRLWELVYRRSHPKQPYALVENDWWEGFPKNVAEILVEAGHATWIGSHKYGIMVTTEGRDIANQALA